MKASSFLRSILVIFFTIITLIINTLASLLPINEVTTAEVSNQFPVLITPIGLTFAIWGVIYTGLIIYSIYQVLPAQQKNPLFDRIGWIYIISACANIIWILLWHSFYISSSVAIMLILFISLIYIQKELSTERTSPSQLQNWTTHVPFDIYLGWISIAMTANIAIALYANGFRGGFLLEEWWALLIIVIISIISAFMVLILKNRTYSIVIIWSLLGILINSFDTLLIFFICGLSIFINSILVLNQIFKHYIQKK